MTPTATLIDPVADAAKVRLERSPYRCLHSLSCEFDRGVLRLSGSLASFYHKQLAQEAVVGLRGVEQVVNEIVVGTYGEGR